LAPELRAILVGEIFGIDLYYGWLDHSHGLLKQDDWGLYWGNEYKTQSTGLAPNLRRQPQ